MSQRFWKRVSKQGADRCWEWIGSKNIHGYGQFFVTRKKNIGAHRYSWAIHNGAIPDGLWVLHVCDNPACVNPAHLFLGTVTDNVRDSVGKGRWGTLHGEDAVNAKLTEEAVREIRSLRGAVSQAVLASRYGVSRELVRDVQLGKKWKHVK